MATVPLTSATRRGYALGSVATGAFGTVPGLLLLPYLTDRLGITAAVAGLIVLLPKAWDVILNPVAGGISDRSTHPDGRRRPFLLKAGIALAITFVLIFWGPTPPTASPTTAATWVIVAFVACASAYAFFQVPYVAMPAEMTDDYDERTRLMSWRVAVLALAILVSGGASPAIRDALGPVWGYRGVGLFVGALLLTGALGAWWGTRHTSDPYAAPPATEAAASPPPVHNPPIGRLVTGRPSEATASPPPVHNPPIGRLVTGRPTEATAPSLLTQLRVVAHAADFRRLLTTFVIQALGIGVMLAGVDYLARVVLARPGASSILFICFVGPALLVTPIWQRLSARLGKRAGYVLSSLLLATGALLTVPTTSLTPMAAAVALIGIGYAGAQMFPLAMLADTAAVDTARTGASRAGVYTGVWTATETLGMAVGPFLYAALLAVSGYVSSTTGQVAQPESAVTAIRLGFGVLPAGLVLVSLVFLTRYRLDAATVAAATSDTAASETARP